jgi:hypothetical protein
MSGVFIGLRGGGHGFLLEASENPPAVALVPGSERGVKVAFD